MGFEDRFGNIVFDGDIVLFTTQTGYTIDFGIIAGNMPSGSIRLIPLYLSYSKDRWHKGRGIPILSHKQIAKIPDEAIPPELKNYV